VTIHQRHR